MMVPFKVYLEKYHDKATHPQFKYLWGIVYKRIAEYTGMSAREVHEYFMEEFELEYVLLLSTGEWELRRKSASAFNKIDIAIYIEKVCAFALLELGIYIEPAT